MSWQEDLRQIDSDLAAGKLSKEQYAVKREELLAEASSAGTAPKAPAAPPRSSKPVPAKDLLTTSRPTTAPSPADERSTDSLPHPPRRPAPKEPATVAIAPAEVPPPVPVAPPPAAPPPAAPPPAAPPPRPQAAAALETLNVPKPAPTPEAYKPGGVVKTWLFLGLGLLVVVALIGGGLWWLTSGDEGTNNAADPPPETTTTAPPTTTTTGKPGLIDRLPELPGVLNRNSGTFTPAEGAERKLYGADEAQVLKRNKVRRVTWKGSSRTAGEAQMAYVILVAQNANARDTAATAKALRELSSGRVSTADGLKGFERLPTFTKSSKEANTYRVIYTSGTRTVRVGVVQTPGVDEKRLVIELTDLLKQVTTELPPDDK